jgi:transcription elongation factor SPT6
MSKDRVCSLIQFRTWREIEDLFGDGSDYQWALDLDKMNIDDNGDMDASPVDGYHVEKPEIKLTDLYEPSEIHAKMLTEEDEVIRIKDIPERYQV